jgi:urease accessory protein
MSVLAMMFADSRFPGGGHVHSGGLEEAVARGLVRTEADLPGFLSGRLRTAGALASVFAASAADTAARGADLWSTLDIELDARTPSAAQRYASRTQGRATARAASAMVVPNVDGACGSPLRALLAATPRPHHAIVLGAVIGSPLDAARTAAYLSVSGPASAAVRLLGLDPLRVNASVAALAPRMESVAVQAAGCASSPPAELPAPGSPGLDLLAEEHDRHHREEVRLFAS